MTIICPLCSGKSSSYFKNNIHEFFQCTICNGIFRDAEQFLNKNEEKKRYQYHKNNINDLGYIKFASPIISTVKKYFNTKHKGLDFGAGHTPVISELLKLDDYQVDIYDPLFFKNELPLKNKYDFITSCEVIEHFYNPLKEFTLLFNLLKPQGKLILMTYIYDKTIDFEKWFYKNDPTHVFIYQKETFRWIKNYFNYKNVKVENRLIMFSL